MVQTYPASDGEAALRLMHEPALSWIKRVRDLGMTAPIRIGTSGPAGIKRLINFARRLGVGANALIVKKYGVSLSNLMGSADQDRFIDDLSARLPTDPTASDVKLHFFDFGGIPATSEWVQQYIDDKTVRLALP